MLEKVLSALNVIVGLRLSDSVHNYFVVIAAMVAARLPSVSSLDR